MPFSVSRRLAEANCPGHCPGRRHFAQKSGANGSPICAYFHKKSVDILSRVWYIIIVEGREERRASANDSEAKKFLKNFSKTP